jgi:hypothetical protein
LKKVLDLNRRASELMIDYDAEINRQNIYSKYFFDYKRVVDSIKEFEEKFGDRQKLILTLE